MPAFSNTIIINAPSDQLFALTQDYDRRLAWDSFLKRAELVGDATTPGRGVRAYCIANSGFGMETEYVSFDPPSGCAIRMTSGPRLIREFAGSWRFRETSPGVTEVAFRYRIVGYPRLLTRLLQWIFDRDTRRRLQGLKQAVEREGILDREFTHSAQDFSGVSS